MQRVLQMKGNSIKKQYSIVFSVLLGGVILMVLLINALFLGRFYRYHKQKVLLSAYEEIDKASSEGDILSESFSHQFDQIASKNNLDILILDSDARMVISTAQDPGVLSNRLLNYLFTGTQDVESLYEGNHVQIQLTADSQMNLRYIELWGVMSNSDMIFMRSPLESIEESASIANRLLVIAGLIAIVLGVVVVDYISNRFTKPIKELADISESMTRLDFSRKYNGKAKNEIDTLGAHINELSSALERTITELKEANIRLEQDIARREELDEMRKDFLSNVSHELKTPIALIQGYSEGLKDCVNDDDDSRDYYCDVIMDEAGKMNRLVRNLLQLNELEFGDKTVTLDHFDLMELIYNCAGSMDIMIKQNDIKLELPKWESMFVWADEFKIEQVFNNYLSNAIHYAKTVPSTDKADYDTVKAASDTNKAAFDANKAAFDANRAASDTNNGRLGKNSGAVKGDDDNVNAAGSKIVRISVARHGDNIRVSVFNSGDHIPDDVMKQLWVKFYKADRARTREYGGNGIGLSIVKAAMDALGKDYGVINVDGGVEFFFEVDALSRIGGISFT